MHVDFTSRGPVLVPFWTGSDPETAPTPIITYQGTIAQLKHYLSGARMFDQWKTEFQGYNFASFRQDLLASITVAAVALPLALAFGVASGATAAAGLVTAIVGGTLIAMFGGAYFQMSGP